MAEGGGVFPRKREGKVAHWHVRFPGTGLQDFVVSVDKEERELAETLLAILRSLDPADHGDNAKLRRISQEKLKHLRQEVHSRLEPNAGPGGDDEAASSSSSSSSDGTSSQLRAAAAAAAAAGRERRKSREVKKKKEKKKEKKHKKHKKGKREKLPKDGKKGKASDTKPVAASPAGASLQIQVECEVCCEDFDATDHAPYLSKCGHTFCQTCMQQIIGKRSTYDCPHCRQTFKRDDCTKNFWIIQHLDALLQARDQASQASGPDTVKRPAAEPPQAEPQAKRPLVSPPGPSPGAASSSGSAVEEVGDVAHIAVSSSAPLTVLEGLFVKSGSNHQRPVYKKESFYLQVYLFFWDSRSGENMSGWWFGTSVGATEVWAFHPSRSAQTPPCRGWREPSGVATIPSLVIQRSQQRTTDTTAPLPANLPAHPPAHRPAQPPAQVQRCEFCRREIGGGDSGMTNHQSNSKACQYLQKQRDHQFRTCRFCGLTIGGGDGGMQNHQRDSKTCQARQAAARAQEAKAAAAASTQQGTAHRAQSFPDSRIGEAGGMQSHHAAAPATPAATREASSGSAFPGSTPPTPRGAATSAAEQNAGSGSDPTSASAVPSPSPWPSGYAQHFSSRSYGGFARPGTPALGFGLPSLHQAWQFRFGHWL